MAVRWFFGLVAALAFVVGLSYQMFALAFCGLLGLVGAVVTRPGSNPLAEPYRDVREPLPLERKDW